VDYTDFGELSSHGKPTSGLTLLIKLAKGALPPKGVYGDPAGMDLYTHERLTLNPGMTGKVNTGVSLKIPEGYYGQIFGRSGLSLEGVHVITGTIDADYTGEVGIIIHNHTEKVLDLAIGSKIAQIIFKKKEKFTIEFTDKLPQTKRGAKGFGSSGRV